MKIIKKKAKSFFIGGENFKKEFRRQLRLLIIVALGFTIAFTWRQTIFDVVESFVIRFINVQGTATLSFLTSFFITIFSLLLMLIASYFLTDRSNSH
ncbi:hypothetical protein COU60_01180 [Candidatus Pacearchaeota archaeon CG10_big_fil_rev_8_21_14_0_10_34_76]|nr:MAG: hypothetical protein COU60_01180 [Candidatus Pacearchaeota archaeon CG10_big_fil_rev_8_21_14_0_10_34_76]